MAIITVTVTMMMHGNGNDNGDVDAIREMKKAKTTATILYL